jgi:hypothetical protein
MRVRVLYKRKKKGMVQYREDGWIKGENRPDETNPLRRPRTKEKKIALLHQVLTRTNARCVLVLHL